MKWYFLPNCFWLLISKLRRSVKWFEWLLWNPEMLKLIIKGSHVFPSYLILCDLLVLIVLYFLMYSTLFQLCCSKMCFIITLDLIWLALSQETWSLATIEPEVMFYWQALIEKKKRVSSVWQIKKKRSTIYGLDFANCFLNNKLHRQLNRQTWYLTPNHTFPFTVTMHNSTRDLFSV